MVNWKSELIARIMDECEVDRTAVPNEFRYQNVHGRGFCYCSKCENSWSSHWVWIKLDVRRAKVDYIFKQKCRNCKNAFRPSIKKEGLEEMTRFVIKRYKDLINGVKPNSDKSGPKKGGKPHEKELCEKCGFGERQCWARLKTEE